MKDRTMMYLMAAALFLNFLIPAPYCWITLAVTALIGISLMVVTLKHKNETNI
ncbi:hypothetical protein [Enterococcus pallens]|uniref:Uncharacterized protein n=1 Tax=Enterococcus pallens ATCC BAA-351 TaxID=1158607 RepID=R2QK09_9ENTE|nr:hypothetical protein [Enterococcus pallens]EOH95503.1 hypothetical protein UAU_01465 [Enterococcus pallens ATCC BAA-351]EOU21360.1 hypothetical protein I588_02207 [Enterococcus pallens ATCC BAA-351]OJG78751.1 hypothetical protein RV10_GL001237 [Enterococcus pallens]